MNDSNPTKTKSDPDTELIQAIRDGEAAMFTDLVQRHERSLYNFGLRMCGVVADAEDLVQETFLNVFKYLKDFRGETKFKNWLYRIAASVCIKKRRKSKFAPDHEFSLEEFLPADEAGVEQQVPAWAALPLDQVLNEELRRRLHEAVLELPEKYRAVLVLRDMEGFSIEESAQILNLTPANIKVRLHRARLFLRDQLKSYYENV
jgi:RNA polymerase sigma-70 factor (ECF subfamily)